MSLSTWSLVAGLAGFFLPVPFVPSALAIWLGRKAKRQGDSSSLTQVGVVLGWIGIVLWSLSCCVIAALGAMQLVTTLGAAPVDTPAEPEFPVQPDFPETESTLPPAKQANPSPYLGILCESRGGARVVEVFPGSPAEKSGLQSGDAILALNTHGVVDCTDLAREIGKQAPGQVVTLKILRGEEILEIHVVLEADQP